MPVTRELNEDSHLYLVDASGYIFRAFHALPPLTRKSDGLPVGAVSGFCNMLYKLLAESKEVTGNGKATHFACIFDASSKTFRNDLDPRYKAQRPPTPEDLAPQFPLVRRAAIAFGTPAVELDNYEADDLIAAYARIAEEKGAKVTIISSDKDLMQLVTDKVSMMDTMKDRHLSFEAVMDKFGVAPDRVTHVQALAGDSVDNVPGVPGIGLKTAAQLINEFGDLEALLKFSSEHVPDKKNKAHELLTFKRHENLVEFADDARISFKLVTLDDHTPVPVAIEEFGVCEPELEQLVPFLDEMEFRTITRRVVQALGDGAEPVATPASGEATIPVTETNNVFDTSQYTTLIKPDDLVEWMRRAQAVGVIGVDTETDGLDAIGANLVGVSLALGPNDACYIPLGHTGDGDLLGDGAPEQMDMKLALGILKPMLEDPTILKVGQNFKYDVNVFHRAGEKFLDEPIIPYPIDDTMLLSAALEAGQHNHGMDVLSELHFDHKPIPFKEVAGTGKKQITFDKVPVPEATKYAAEDADVTLRLWALLKPRLSAEGMATLYETIERPMVPVVAQMERAGIFVERETLSRLSGDFAQRMAQYEAEAYELAGREFNMGSPKQLGEILFGEMELPGGKKTKTGAWATGADALEDLAAEGHELPKILLGWRSLSKLKSTYTDALGECINAETGRVHTSFNLVGAQTGRLSSSDPNLQNIPIRTEEGRKIRAAFVAQEGNVLIAADYSQIELRLLAHIGNIDTLKDAFNNDLDIHAMTASEMFGVPIEGMDPMIRRKAKAINFGIIYGISAFGLARQLGIPRGEASEYIKAYNAKFPGILKYMDEMKAFAREKGYVETAFGRRIWMKGINGKGPERGFAERQAINAPLQGSAADIIKRAMVKMPAALEKSGLQAKMLLQVHDELIFEAPKAEAEKTIKLVKKIMETATFPVMDLSVPLLVEAEAAHSWNEAH
ncbi:DNA polymerase I [Hirschia baltica]|uniref:DNA polymerase I n=1 Tax=Hirschia baltica (strain ATCC 49814 / DSM 5838 / IFAM 1418) TaxID=582402 RepID=C6XL49_HIRBI|nr:DNA polymerase I [Hirschia baltica]ACT57878.1 DNA polymerase I [Hirschia baltica ATCC 49814]